MYLTANRWNLERGLWLMALLLNEVNRSTTLTTSPSLKTGAPHHVSN